MLVGLVSDTHDNLPLVERAVQFFRERETDLVLHLGDITEPAVVERFQDLRAQFIRGNNDDPRELDPALRKMGFASLSLDFDAVLDGVHVHAHHGHLAARPPREPDVLLHGHTHRRRHERVGRTLVINPGALQRAPVKTIALLELPDARVEFYEVKESGVAGAGRRQGGQGA